METSILSVDMSGAPLAVPVLLLALAAGSAAGAREAPAGVRSEKLHYRWRLEGLSGVLARILTRLPTTGDAVIELRARANDRLEVAFTGTSEKAAEDEYWKYEAVVNPEVWLSLRVTETLRYKKKHKTKTVELTDLEAIDVLSGLQQLRYVPTERIGRHTIWSDGKVYPVAVSAGALERRQVNDFEVTVRQLAIRGLKEPDRHLWKAWAELWLTDDDAAVPVEIVFHQALGQLRMTLVDVPVTGQVSPAE